MILWRAGLLLMGTTLLAVAANDAYHMIACPSVLAYTLGALHFIFFLALGAGMILVALLCDGTFVRDATKEFLRDVCSRRNLLEVAVLFAAAAAVALVCAAFQQGT